MTKHLLTAAFCCLTAAAAGHAAEPASYLREPMPAQWNIEPAHLQQLPTEDSWWVSLGDSTLVRLLDMAERNNFNVLQTARRIEAARQAINEVRSGYFPTIGVNGSWNKGQSSGRQAAVAGPSAGYGYWSLGLNAQWEIDLFGRINANAAVAKDAYNATRAEYAGVMVTLASNIATTYINLRVSQEQLAVAKAHIQQQERMTQMTEARQEAGLGNMLEVNQSRVVLYSTQATVPGLEASIQTSINALALLVGEYPDSIAPMLERDRAIRESHTAFETGVPLDLLRRRPDVVQAELQMARYAALTGVARKDFLPSLSISGSIGTVAHDAKHLFGSHSMTYAVAPQLSWTLFDGLARNYRVAEAKANFEASVDQYNLTVMTAVEEVNNALAKYEAAQQSIEFYKQTIEASREALHMSIDRYKQGLAEYTAVVTAQMDYLNYQNQLITAKGNSITALVTLYDALGGGWDGALPDVK